MQQQYVLIKFTPNRVILNRSCTILNDRVGANSKCTNRCLCWQHWVIHCGKVLRFSKISPRSHIFTTDNC